ncbi:MAG: Ig-like domain-containing protein [Candidatus Acidiferrum sp.]|jgi:hypothetical protein
MKRLLAGLVLFLLPALLHAQQAAPQISLTANGYQTINLYPGWPLIIHTSILNSLRLTANSTAGPLLLAPTSGAWTSAIQFTATSSSGQVLQWPLQLVGQPETPTLTLSASSYVRAVWQISPTDVSAIPAGSYQLVASIQINNSQGWNGTVQSGPIAITMGPEPTLTSDQQTDKALLLAEYNYNNGDLTDALNAVQQNLTAQPQDTASMAAIANLIELDGYPQVAFFAASNAVSTYYQLNPTPIEAPFNLLTMYERLLGSMTGTGTGPADTSMVASNESADYSPMTQAVSLTATVTSSSGTVDGGTVGFSLPSLNLSVISTPVVQGSTTASLSLPAGTPAGNYEIQATYMGTVSFAPSTDAAHSLSIEKATPTISWTAPTSMSSGTTLGPAQLDATANIPGTFAYNPPAGTILPSSSTQTLNATFTPTNTTDYTTSNASVQITVGAGSFTGSVSPTSATIAVGGSQNFAISIESATLDGPLTIGCASPPSGVSCQFAAASLSLTPGGQTTTTLTVKVTKIPETSSTSFQTTLYRASKSQTIAEIFLLVAVVYIAAFRRHTLFRQPARFAAALLLGFVLLNLSACVQLEKAGLGGPGNPEGSQVAKLSLQGTSGNATTSVATIDITIRK